MENKLYGKTILWNGDSICAGNEIKGNWATRIAAKNSMIFKNYAVGGGVIVETQKDDEGWQRHSVLLTIDKMYEDFPDADYVVFEGGTNDADLIEVLGHPGSLGTIDPYDFSGNYDTTSFCGALETVFHRAVKYWYGKKICYVIPQKMGPEPDKFRARTLYFAKAREICRKWGIPFVDLWQTCPLNPFLPWMYNPDKTPTENNDENTCMYIDGQHLTVRGYDYTAELIEEQLKAL